MMGCCDKWRKLKEDIVQICIKDKGEIEKVYWGDGEEVSPELYFQYCPYCRSEL